MRLRTATNSSSKYLVTNTKDNPIILHSRALELAVRLT